jgi:hypothetical protein
MAQVQQHLPSKCEGLSSNPSTTGWGEDERSFFKAISNFVHNDIFWILKTYSMMKAIST